MTDAIATEQLTKVYRGKEAVSKLSMTVEQGQVFGFLGPNGAGKTTTIQMLLGSISPTSGSALLFGEKPGSRNVRKRIGYLPERFQFHDFLTAREFLVFHGKLAGMSRGQLAAAVPAVLGRVGLADRANDRLRSFSKGMQQRAGLAQALIHDPDLIILDEPTSALDPLGRRDVRDIILELRSRGKTVLLNSHLLSEIEMTCDRVAIIKNGSVSVQGDVRDLLAFNSMVDIEVEQLNDAAMTAIRAIAAKIKFQDVPIRRFTAWVKREEDLPDLAAAIVQNGVRLSQFAPRRETLEELFLRIVDPV